MIISVEQAKELVDLSGWTEKKIQMKLDAIESVIRKYTHNNFQNRALRADCSIIATKIYGKIPGLKVGDTIEINESWFSDGLHVVEAIEDVYITVDSQLLDEPHALVTKVEYPADVVECAVDLLEWSVNYGGKVGIKSETLSRHSVTYEDSATLFMGYPTGVLNGLKLHMKARF
mgnify:CR=1 FL=1